MRVPVINRHDDHVIVCHEPLRIVKDTRTINEGSAMNPNDILTKRQIYMLRGEEVRGGEVPKVNG